MFGISKAEIQSRIKDKLLDDLGKHGEVVIEGVGQLVLQGNGELKFYPDSAFLTAVQRRRRDAVS